MLRACAGGCLSSPSWPSSPPSARWPAISSERTAPHSPQRESTRAMRRRSSPSSTTAASRATLASTPPASSTCSPSRGSTAARTRSSSTRPIAQLRCAPRGCSKTHARRQRGRRTSASSRSSRASTRGISRSRWYGASSKGGAPTPGRPLRRRSGDGRPERAPRARTRAPRQARRGDALRLPPARRRGDARDRRLAESWERRAGGGAGEHARGAGGHRGVGGVPQRKRQPKSRIVARYLFEHLFFAHLQLDETPGTWFRLVRSRTPPSTPIDEISTIRPYDDPGTPRFAYRLRRITETIVEKTHVPYRLGAEKLAHLRHLFLDADWGKRTHHPPFVRPRGRRKSVRSLRQDPCERALSIHARRRALPRKNLHPRSGV